MHLNSTVYETVALTDYAIGQISDVNVELNYLKLSIYQDKNRIELLRYSKVSSPDNHICNAAARESPSPYTEEQHSDIIW